MAANAPDIDILEAFTTCGLAPNIRNLLIQNEQLFSLEDFALLESKDLFNMAKSNASRTVNDGRIILTTLQVKRLQALLFWCRDRITRGQALVGGEFDPVALNQSVAEMRLSDAKMENPAVSELSKFEPDEFELHEDKFRNLVSRTSGVRNTSLVYLTRDRLPPVTFRDDDHRRMYEMQLVGPEFNRDNKKVWGLLKAWLINSPGYTWIQNFEDSENGREAWLAFVDHYNGDGEKSKRTALADANIKSLHYSSERAMSFEKFSSKLTASFLVLDKDETRKYLPMRKVQILLEKIKIDNVELRAAKNIIRELPLDPADTLFERAVNKYSTYVTQTFNESMVEARQNKRRRVSAAGRSGGRGRGRGRFGGHGRARNAGGRGHGGRGGGRGQSVNFNGVDVSDPTRDFSREEFDNIGASGRAYIAQQRAYLNGGRGNGGRGRGRDNDRNVSELRTDDAVDGEEANPGNNNGQRGGRNGRGFGRGAHGGRPGHGN